MELEVDDGMGSGLRHPLLLSTARTRENERRTAMSWVDADSRLI
jgi:hypothetical protein